MKEQTNSTSFLKRLLVFFGYLIPIFGWMLPIYLNKKDKTLNRHGKQAFLITVALISNSIFYLLLSRLIPIQYKKLELLFWGLIAFIYFIIAIFSGFKSLISLNFKLPLFTKIADKLPL